VLVPSLERPEACGVQGPVEAGACRAFLGYLSLGCTLNGHTHTHTHTLDLFNLHAFPCCGEMSGSAEYVVNFLKIFILDSGSLV